jgi:hypothetical protein
MLDRSLPAVTGVAAGRAFAAVAFHHPFDSVTKDLLERLEQ